MDTKKEKDERYHYQKSKGNGCDRRGAVCVGSGVAQDVERTGHGGSVDASDV